MASIGIAFGFAYIAAFVGYSVALGAFIAGSLIAESGVAKTVEHLVMPVRDMFAAIFFVSVGMMIDPIEILQNWHLVLVFTAIVVAGNLFAVTIGSFLTGQSVQTSVRTGMSLAQIGEFSFIIAGVGVTMASAEARPTYELLYSIAVAVSGITTLLTPWLIRAAEPTAAIVDRELPRSLQTFVALYGTWLEKLQSSPVDEDTNRVRQLVRWLVVDAVVVAAIIIGASLELDTISSWAQQQFQISPNMSTAFVVAAAAFVSAPFWIGMVRVSRVLGFELANRVFPVANARTSGPGGRAAEVAGGDAAAGDRGAGGHSAGGDHAAVRADGARGGGAVVPARAVGVCVLAERHESAGSHPGGGAGDGPGDRSADAQRAGDGGRPARDAGQARRCEPDHHGARLAGVDRAAAGQLGGGADARRGEGPRAHRRDDPGDRAGRRVGGGAGGRRAAAGRRCAGGGGDAHGGRSGAGAAWRPRTSITSRIGAVRRCGNWTSQSL